MGEQKRRAGHVPPPDMVNASGRVLRDMTRDIHDRAVRAVNVEHLDFEVMIGGVLAVAIDLVRVNAGDQQADRAVRRFVEQRLSKPLEYWGVSRDDGR